MIPSPDSDAGTPNIQDMSKADILHPYGNYKDWIPSKPLEFISKEDLKQSAPGLIEHHGQKDEMEVLSPYAVVFLETLPEIRNMHGFRAVLGDVDKHQDVTGTNPLSPRERYVTLKILKVLEYKEKHSSSMPDQKTEDDRAIAIFAERLADHMWKNQGSGTEKFDDYDVFVENLISHRYRELNRQTRKYSGSESATPALYPATRAFAETDAAQDPNEDQKLETQADIETMLADEKELSAGIAGYSETNADPTPFDAARTSQAKDFVDNCILGRLPASEIKSPSELPTIVILRGVAQNKDLWQERIKFYESKGINVKFIDYPQFDNNMTFEKQAEIVFDELNTGWDKKSLFAIEAHSWGGLIAPYLMKNHPEMFSHAIITSAPTRSNKEEYSLKTKALVKGLNWALQHEDQAWNIIQKIPGMKFFQKMGCEGFPEAFRIYLSHIGKAGQSQWDEVIKSCSWTIPKFIMYGDQDNMVVKIGGMAAANEYDGATLVRNPNGGHHAIGNDEDALEVHCRLYTQAQKRRRAIIN